MKILKYILPILLIGVFCSFRPSKAPKPQIKWYEWNEGYELAKKENKIIFVHIYTSWCPYCKQMEKESFKDTSIVNTLNSNYVNIRFDPEKKGEKYKMDNYLLDGEQLLLLIGKNKIMGYPSQVFVYPSKNFQKEIYVETGYHKPVEFRTILSHVLDNSKKVEQCADGMCMTGK